MTVRPGQKGTFGVEEVPHPDLQDGALVVVRGRAIGVCGTDREIADGVYGTPPCGEERLIIGHESLGEVIEAPAGSGFSDRSATPPPQRLASGGIMCLTGIMNLDPTLDLDATSMNRNMVLRNQVLFGTVNAGRRHWEQAAEALAAANRSWLSGLITRRVPLTSWAEALDRQPEDIKVVVELTA
jgi:threonine dehydrogenase-like Zn-dependent dehydrogenase